MNNPRYRSFFWPMAFIGVGVIWLLSNLGVLRAANIGALLAFWPLILVFIGLDILFGRRSPIIGGLLGVLAIVTVVVLLIFGPALNLPTNMVASMQTRNITEPVGGATAATVAIDFSSQPVQVHEANSTANLMEAEIDYYGGLAYSSTGNPTRQVSLSPSGGFSFVIGDDWDARWDIGLNSGVPMDLRLNGASGPVAMDLASLNLTAFSFDQGSGVTDITLPESTDGYTAQFRGASGTLDVTLPANSDLTMNLRGASGSIHLMLPAGVAVRLEVVHSGSGSVNVPDGMQRVSGGDNGKQGVWETAGYDTAANQISITCDSLGSGSFNLEF